MALCMEAVLHRLHSFGCFKSSGMPFDTFKCSKHLFSLLCSSPSRLKGSPALIFRSVHTEICPLKWTGFRSGGRKVSLLSGRFNSLGPNSLWGQAHYASSFLPLRPQSAALAEDNLRGDTAWPGRFRKNIESTSFVCFRLFSFKCNYLFFFHSLFCSQKSDRRSPL